MNKFKILFLMLAVTFTACTSNKYQKKVAKDSNGYTYEAVSNDPAELRIYTLQNGLKVYLSPNHNEPRVMGLIGIKIGRAHV